MNRHRSLRSLAMTALFTLSSVCIASAGRDDSTEMMNAYGETMELDFSLYDPGDAGVVDYSKYGTFNGVGTDRYEYRMTDKNGLAAAVGEGIYPNNTVYKDPAYRMLVSKGKLTGSRWDYVHRENQELTFYKWATTADVAGVKQFYTAAALEKLGQTLQAVKAYYAIVVHFPKHVGWTIWKTPIYMGRLAIDRIDFLTRQHPELGLKLVGAKVTIVNGYNRVTSDDRFIVSPGKLIKTHPREVVPKPVEVGKLRVIRTLGNGSVQLVQFENHHWQLRVDGKPFMVHGIAYTPTPVGKTPDRGYKLDSWQTMDLNKNGQIDGPFDAWVDKNKNNEQDPDEKAVGDFALLKDMGVNTVRFYHHALNKELLRRLYGEYGIRVIMGDFLGMYAVGSGAEWFRGTDYTDPEQKEKMKESVRQMVLEYKDEPYILMWMLGNESNYGEVGSVAKEKVGTGSQAAAQPEELYKFADEVAAMIKSLDPSHLVGFSNGDTITIDLFSRHSGNIDVFGTNAYRGSSGFGRSFWQDARDFLDKPVLLTEYGCPAYCMGKSADFAEGKQLEYNKGNWEDIFYNRAGSGFGNAIGGVLFEYLDEWWKAGPPPRFNPAAQETVGQFAADFPDGWMHEEWLGLAGQGDGRHSPYMRQLRKSYGYYKKVWN